MQPVYILIIIFGLFLVTLFTIRFWLNQLEQKTKTSGELIAWLQDIGQRLQTSTSAVDTKLTKNMEMFNTRLDNAAQVIGQVQKSIGEFSEIGRSMQQFQQFLASPKLRGNIGEHILKEILAQHFPPDLYALQYAFKNGEKVDAIIKTQQGIIPIDAKFPIDNFRKMMEGENLVDREKMKKLFIGDVKKHIQDIAKKYILSSEGTVDYALMYIPSEAVYYEIINDPELYDFASLKRVLVLSPMSFYAYIKAILMSYEGQRIQSQAKEILKTLLAIKKDYEKSDEAFSVLNKHLTNAYNQSSQFSKNFLSLGQKLDSTRLLQPEKKEEKLLEEV